MTQSELDLPNGASYDTSLSFEAQSVEAKAWISEALVIGEAQVLEYFEPINQITPKCIQYTYQGFVFCIENQNTGVIKNLKEVEDGA